MKIDTQNLMDDLVRQTIDSVNRNENLNTDGNSATPEIALTS